MALNLDKGKVKIETLFDENGNMLHERDFYFDEDGDSIHWFEISKHYEKFPANSDIVKLYYADVYGTETSGFYSGETLYSRAF